MAGELAHYYGNQLSNCVNTGEPPCMSRLFHSGKRVITDLQLSDRGFITDFMHFITDFDRFITDSPRFTLITKKNHK